MSSMFLSEANAVAARIAPLGSSADASVITLEDRLVQGFASASVQTQQEYTAINAMLERTDITSPEVLAELQIRMAQYNIDVNLLNTLVRKSVTMVETLLRSS
jgi:hypothetical protein